MAGLDLPPRQRMINMMYLFYTALLALNVSKDILDAFVGVNQGLENTKVTFTEKMDNTYNQFASMARESPAKYGRPWQEAQQIQASASELISHIDTLKALAISWTEGLPMEKVIGNFNGVDTVIGMQYLKKRDQYDKLTTMMVGSEPGKPRQDANSAYELREMLTEFREKVKAALPNDATIQASADRIFDFSDQRDASGTLNNWESMNFYHVPIAAGITLLSKMQTDVRSMENEVVGRMLGSVEMESFKFNTLEAIVQPRSSYVSVGGKYQANIFLGAYDNQNAPQVLIAGPGAYVDTTVSPPRIVGESTELPLDGAKAVLELPANSPGLKTVTGIIKFKPVGGTEQVQPFRTEYEVAAPNLVVSPTKMNVFYRGVENPVSISVSGYSASDIAPSITNGTLARAKDGFIVKPGNAAKSVVSVTVTNPDGSKKTLPGVEFRVKNVPDPTPVFGGKGVGDETIRKSELIAAAGLIARLENFEFDLRFDVVSYTVATTARGQFLEQECRGPALTADAKKILSQARSGQRIYFDNIKVKGPDGRVRSIGSLSFRVV